MKKIKLFALAVCAMLSTTAFAANVIHSNTILRYTYDDTNIAGGATILSFVTELPAASQVTLEIPATVLQSDNETPINVTAIAANAFEGNTNIKTLTIADANVATINDEAFKGCTALESVTFGKAVTTIGTTADKGAFSGCTKLATVTFNAANAAQTIAAGAFVNTAITSLDLTPTKVAILNPLFETVGAKVTEIKLPATLTSIEASAFSGLTKLASVDFTACEKDITINENAFKNTMAITSFTVPGVVTQIANGAFAGSYITALTIDATDAEHILKVGVDASIGATKITTLTVNGAKLTIEEGAFADAAALKTVTFNNDLDATTVKAGAFAKNGTQAITVNYTPTGATPAANAFAQGAFRAADAGAAADQYVTFVTSETYGTALNGTNAWTVEGAWGVKLSYTATSPTIEVANNGSGKYYYAGLTVPAGGMTIAKKQGDANVMVYGAYFDYGTTAATSAIIMDQLHLIGGKYYIPAGANIIVKSSSEADVEYTAGGIGTNDSQNYKTYDNGTSYTLVNKIQAYGGAQGDPAYAIDIVNALGKPVYFLKPIAEFGFGWSQFADDRAVAKGQLYLLWDKTDAAPARINVIWSDGSEEDQVTGIQKIAASVKESGAIYNLAGQKVSASYKGVVIKDGKKYIQK